MGKAGSGAVLQWIRRVDTVDLGGFEQHLCADLGCPQRRCCVCGEERIACACREDDDASLLQVAHSATRDERLGDLLHGDCTLHAAFHVEVFDGVAQGERVDDGGQHPHVIAG